MENWQSSIRQLPGYQWLRARVRPLADLPLTPAQEKNRRYDQQAAAVIFRVFATARAGAIAIDGGCHQGLILQQLMAAPPGVHHGGFEPMPELCRKLFHRFPHQKILPFALADYEGECCFDRVINVPAPESYQAVTIASFSSAGVFVP